MGVFLTVRQQKAEPVAHSAAYKVSRAHCPERVWCPPTHRHAVCTRGAALAAAGERHGFEVGQWAENKGSQIGEWGKDAGDQAQETLGRAEEVLGQAWRTTNEIATRATTIAERAVQNAKTPRWPASWRGRTRDWWAMFIPCEEMVQRSHRSSRRRHFRIELAAAHRSFDPAEPRLTDDTEAAGALGPNQSRE